MPEFKDCKDITRDLGKSHGIEVQDVSVAMPKRTATEIIERDDGLCHRPTPATPVKFRRIKIKEARSNASS